MVLYSWALVTVFIEGLNVHFVAEISQAREGYKHLGVGAYFV